MTNVMSMAWGIARKAQAKFGGGVKQYFAASLKQAWDKIKNTPVKIASELNNSIYKILKNGKVLRYEVVNIEDYDYEFFDELEKAMEVYNNWVESDKLEMRMNRGVAWY